MLASVFVRRENLGDRNGIFFPKSLSDAATAQQVWQVYQSAASASAPSRKGSRSDRKDQTPSRHSGRLLLSGANKPDQPGAIEGTAAEAEVDPFAEAD